MSFVEDLRSLRSEREEQGCVDRIWSLFRDGDWGRYSFGYLIDVIKHECCPVCRMLTHLVKQYQGRDQPVTHDQDAKKIQCIIEGFGGRDKVTDDDIAGPEVLNLGVKIERFAIFGEQRLAMEPHLDYGYVPNEGYIFKFFKASKELSKADPTILKFQRSLEVDDGTLGIDFLLAWTSAFHNTHSAKCLGQKTPKSKSDIPGFKLIDVGGMNLIDAPPYADYVALSYVWGLPQGWLQCSRNNIINLEERSGLLSFHEQLPQTFRDAITLCRRLGFQYLWIDALCIIQDDESHKLKQIKCMGSIYQDAKIVVAAAHGYNVNAGLPGVKAGPFPLRGVRRREYIHLSARLLSGTPHVRRLLKRTYWMSRAWTYQEFILAPLTLVLTPVQALLVCKCGVFSEETHALDAFHCDPKDPESRIANDINAALPFAKINRESDCLWNEYRGHVEEYTKRKLSYPSDILFAFSAIMKELQEKWKTPFLLGHPQRLFNPTLIWSHQGQGRRLEVLTTHGLSVMQCKLPSWSWASCMGPIFYELLDLHSLEEPRSPNTDACDYIPSNLDPEWQAISGKSGLTTENDQAEDFSLQADVWTAFFNLGPLVKKDQLKRYPARCDSRMHPVRLRGDDCIISFIDIPSNPYWTFPEEPEVSCEFVAITVRRDYGFWRGYTEIICYEPGLKLTDNAPNVVHAMLITRRPDGIAYRVAVAGIHEDDWRAANPTKNNLILA